MLAWAGQHCKYAGVGMIVGDRSDCIVVFHVVFVRCVVPSPTDNIERGILTR